MTAVPEEILHRGGSSGVRAVRAGVVGRQLNSGLGKRLGTLVRGREGGQKRSRGGEVNLPLLGNSIYDQIRESIMI